jgi:hypothetical protein
MCRRHDVYHRRIWMEQCVLERSRLTLSLIACAQDVHQFRRAHRDTGKVTDTGRECVPILIPPFTHFHGIGPDQIRIDLVAERLLTLLLVRAHRRWLALRGIGGHFSSRQIVRPRVEIVPAKVAPGHQRKSRARGTRQWVGFHQVEKPGDESAVADDSRREDGEALIH